MFTQPLCNPSSAQSHTYCTCMCTLASDLHECNKWGTQKRGKMTDVGFRRAGLYLRAENWLVLTIWRKGEWKCQKHFCFYGSSFINMKYFRAVALARTSKGQDQLKHEAKPQLFGLLVHVRSLPTTQKIGLYSTCESTVLVSVSNQRQQQGMSVSLRGAYVICKGLPGVSKETWNGPK